MESSTSSSSTAARGPQLLAEARKTPINRIPEQTRAAVLSRIVRQTHLVSAAFQSSI